MKLPSPAISTTVLFVQATLAPREAGNPNPIVPKPPDVINVLGRYVSKYNLVHIWFCPTSVATIVSFGRIFLNLLRSAGTFNLFREMKQAKEKRIKAWEREGHNPQRFDGVRVNLDKIRDDLTKG